MSTTPAAFAHAIAFLNRRRFVTKLSILGVLFLVPLLVALGYVGARVHRDIAICRDELEALDCERLLVHLESAVRLRQRLALQVAADKTAVAGLRAVSGNVNILIRSIKRVDTPSSQTLTTSKDWRAVETYWGQITTSGEGGDPVVSHQVQEQLESAITACCHLTSSRSSLIVDPGKDSSCLIDSITVQIPRLNLIINGMENSSPAGAGPDDQAAGKRSVLQGELAGPWQSAMLDVEEAAAVNPSLTGTIIPPAIRFADLMRGYSESLAPTAHGTSATVGADQLILAGDTLYEAVVAATRQLISSREQQLVAGRNTMILLTVTCLLLAAYGLVALYLAIMKSVSELGSKARQLTAGDLNLDLNLVARDEIGAVGAQTLQEIDRNLRELKALRAEIDERQKAEAALRQSEARYRRMFEGNRAIQWLVDPETCDIVDANPAACQFYGYTLDELKQMKLYDINTSSREEIEIGLKNVEYSDGASVAAEHKLANGDLVAVEIRPTLVDIAGKQLIHAIITDVTDRDMAVSAREAAEAKYEKIFENAVEGIFQSSLDGKYLSANPALARIYGYDTPEELTSAISDIATQLYVDSHRREDLRKAVDTHGSIVGVESEVYRKDGSTIWIEENIRAIRDSDGVVQYFEGTVQDVTIRRALEEQRDRMLREAVDRADRDPLTGLLNHRAFHKRLSEEAARAIEKRTKFAVTVIDLDNFKVFNDAYGHIAGDEVLKLIGGTLFSECRPNDILARFGGDEFALIIPGQDTTELQAFVDNLVSVVSDLGYHAPGYDFTIPLTVSAGIAIFPDETGDRLEALEMADARMIRSKSGDPEGEEFERLRRSLSKTVAGFSMLDALITAVDNKDRYTRRHSEDVLTYSVEIARRLGFDDTLIYDVKVAALLHDVGKIGVPDYVLRKPARLTTEEFEAIKQHPMMGAVIVAAVPGLETTLDAVRHHHERWDGEGYPWGLKGEEIPLMARLMAVADAYSAMTTDRPYRKGMPPDTALQILEEGAGTQWDPTCVALFLEVHAADREARRDITSKESTPLTSVYISKVA